MENDPMTTTLTVKREININTIIAVVGFLTTFGGIVAVWTGLQYKQVEFTNWINAHEALHKNLETQIDQLQSRDVELTQLSFRLGQNEKALENVDLRIGRITDSYGTQFADIRAQLNAIATQQALTNQALQRMETGHDGVKRKGMMQ